MSGHPAGYGMIQDPCLPLKPAGVLLELISRKCWIMNCCVTSDSKS